jgi:tetratricopeptide (TPR) repeat protein
MRKCLPLFLLFVIFFTPCSAQIFSEENSSTYALVVGISNYEHDSIPDLRFAHRDAEIFAKYLRSKAGGEIPEDQIYSFINDKATSSAIYEALDQIKDRVVEDDKVIIYFSGHGDKETDEYDELGYLLAYNTPFNNYRNNAIRIEDLNLDARTLTLKKGAEVVFFIDACHAGALSGVVNMGPSLSARELEQLSGKEVRFMSCESKQKSLELPNLEGGRGLFSYFLIKGLIGAAEQDESFTVTLEELKSYVRKNVKELAKQQQHDQVPVVKGDDEDYLMAFIDETIFSRIKSLTISTMAALNGEEESADELVMSSSADQPNSEFLESQSRSVSGSPAFSNFESAINSSRLLASGQQQSAYQIYQEQLTKSTDKKELARMKSQLVVALQDEAQLAINAYLDGDYEELNRRLYVRYADSYAKYPEYLKVAAELVGPDYATYDAIKVKQLYFEGINYRLSHLMDTTFKVEDMKIAMNLQKQALQLDDKAAYVHNEVGVLYNLNGDQEAAMLAFEKAHSIAPTWVIPMTNIANHHLRADRSELARTWALKATAQRQNYAPANMILGRLQTKANNHLFAEMHYRRALLDNWSSFKPFEALAKYYTLTGQYELADHLYKEVAFRKRGLQPVTAYSLSDGTVNLSVDSPSMPVMTESQLLDLIRADRDNYNAWSELAELYMIEKRYEEAETCLFQVYRINPNYCFLYTSFGKLYAAWNRYDDAIIWLKEGIALSLEITDCNPRSLAASLYPLYEALERNEEAERLIAAYFPEELWNFYYRMIQRYPEDPNYWYKRGMLVYDQNRDTDIYEVSGTTSISVDWQEYLTEPNGDMDITVDRSRLVYLPDIETWNLYWGNPVITDFEQTLELDANFPSRWDIRLKLADLYRTRGELFLGTVFLENRMLLEGVVSNSTLQYNHYRSFIEETKKAIDNAEAALKIYDDQAEARYRLVDLYMDIFEPERSLELLYELRDFNWINPSYRRQLARAQMLMGQLDSAFYSLSFALDKNVGPGREDHEIASLYFQLQGNYDKAIDQLELAEAHYDQVSGTPFTKKDMNYRKAILLALDKKEKETIKALESAFEAGFDYRHVLQNDPALKDIRTSNKYKKLLRRFELDSTFICDESLN